MKKTTILSILVAILFIALVGALLWARHEKQKPYSFLVQVAQQKLGVTGEHRKGLADCYPVGTGRTSCPAITFVVDKQTCLDALRAIGTDSGPANDDCTENRTSFTHNGEDIHSYIGEGTDNNYWVQLRLESDM